MRLTTGEAAHGGARVAKNYATWPVSIEQGTEQLVRWQGGIQPGHSGEHVALGIAQ